MKTFRELLHYTTRGKTETINITGDVEQACQKSGITDGLVLVFPLHTSSGVYISDSDTSLTDDFSDVLSGLVPAGKGYRHDETDHKKNADGHMKANLTGHHITLPLTAGRLDLGTYQTVYYAEFDGQREKEVMVKVIGE